MKKRQAIRAELETIRRKNKNILRAEDVVEFAKDPNTALNGCFEWNDKRAAHQHRLEQARTIIRVHIIVTEMKTEPVRTFVSLINDRKTKGGGYRHIKDVMSSDEMRESLLQEARWDMERFKAKYKNLLQLSKVFDSMEEVLSDMENIRARKTA